MNNDLKLIVLESFKEVGKKINEHLNTIRGTDTNYLIDFKEVRFNNGEGKIELLETIRNKDVYIITDPGNYNITYKMYNFLNHKSPDDHFQDIKRVLCAVKDNSKQISVLMPLLYASRQHRRNGRESLDCALALQDLVSLNISNILTFDVHDINIQNAIPKSSFESFLPIKEIIKAFLETENIDFTNMFVIAPDIGAMGRANLFANLFSCKLGFFRKERNTSVLIDGKNPIINHQYIGPSLKGKNVIIVDDMIASGTSIIEVAEEAKHQGSDKVFLFSTFALFTAGIEPFINAYENKLFDSVYTTNLTYFNPKYKDLKWLRVVDCSMKIAKIIDTLNKGTSLSPLLDESDTIYKIIKEKTTIKKD